MCVSVCGCRLCVVVASVFGQTCDAPLSLHRCGVVPYTIRLVCLNSHSSVRNLFFSTIYLNWMSCVYLFTFFYMCMFCFFLHLNHFYCKL